MKKFYLIIAISSLPVTILAQTAQQLTPSHLPRQRTEANMTSWVRQYPKEAAAYNEQLSQRMASQKQETPTEQQQYDALKQEYINIDQKLRAADNNKQVVKQNVQK